MGIPGSDTTEPDAYGDPCESPEWRGMERLLDETEWQRDTATKALREARARIMLGWSYESIRRGIDEALRQIESGT